MLVRKFSFSLIEAKIQLFKSYCYPIYGRALFAMNATDHINVVFHKSAYSLMSRVTTFPNSIVTAIVNSDANPQSPLIDKWENMLYV